MISFLQKAWAWIKTHTKLVCFGLGSIFVLSLSLYIATRNSKIRRLELELSIVKAKMLVEKLACQYEVSVKELAKLQASQAEIQTKIDAVKKEVEKKAKELEPPMTAEEIADLFRQINLS